MIIGHFHGHLLSSERFQSTACATVVVQFALCLHPKSLYRLRVDVTVNRIDEHLLCDDLGGIYGERSMSRPLLRMSVAH